MDKKLIYALVGSALIFFIVSLVIFLQSNRGSDESEDLSAEKDVIEEVNQPELINIKVFFYTERSRYMRPILHEVEFPGLREDLYKKLIDLLITGEEDYISPVPQGVRLRTLYFIEDENLLVLDFNEDLLLKFPAGSGTELEFIYFFVDNFCYNFKEIKKVVFLVAGNKIKSISGHIDMENPFYPHYGYLIDQ
ncbi:MAG: GerMN domain-containing protein [Candidatus Aminicenantes bacterium]|nr:GerMN domain-containing protein [Candidatus Aminicenantes bacterium]